MTPIRNYHSPDHSPQADFCNPNIHGIYERMIANALFQVRFVTESWLALKDRKAPHVAHPHQNAFDWRFDYPQIDRMEVTTVRPPFSRQ